MTRLIGYNCGLTFQFFSCKNWRINDMIYAVRVMCNNYNESWKDVRMKFKF